MEVYLVSMYRRNNYEHGKWLSLQAGEEQQNWGEAVKENFRCTCISYFIQAEYIHTVL